MRADSQHVSAYHRDMMVLRMGQEPRMRVSSHAGKGKKTYTSLKPPE